jgi:hypothetical protein
MDHPLTTLEKSGERLGSMVFSKDFNDECKENYVSNSGDVSWQKRMCHLHTYLVQAVLVHGVARLIFSEVMANRDSTTA